MGRGCEVLEREIGAALVALGRGAAEASAIPDASAQGRCPHVAMGMYRDMKARHELGLRGTSVKP